MHTLLHDRAFCHVDFLTLPLGEWSRRSGLEPLTPGGRHLRRRAGSLSASMANTLAEIHGLGKGSAKFSGTA
jgi:hypothetical protein